jgi:hypothetical protein
LRDPAIYPPRPINKAPPRHTRPVKWARKSKDMDRRAKRHVIQTTLCQYKSGIIMGARSMPRISASLGIKRYPNSFGEAKA